MDLDLKVPPVAVWLIHAAGILALEHWVPATRAAFPGQHGVGTTLVLLGAAIILAGVVAFRRAGTTSNPLSPEKATSVVQTGIYGSTRNPMYLGMAAALLGVACWHPTIPGYMLVPVFCVYLTRFQIKPEERALTARFGDEYTSYMALVRRWL